MEDFVVLLNKRSYIFSSIIFEIINFDLDLNEFIKKKDTTLKQRSVILLASFVVLENNCKNDCDYYYYLKNTCGYVIWKESSFK